jgi:hypothetical protein
VPHWYSSCFSVVLEVRVFEGNYLDASAQHTCPTTKSNFQPLRSCYVASIFDRFRLNRQYERTSLNIIDFNSSYDLNDFSYQDDPHSEGSPTP